MKPMTVFVLVWLALCFVGENADARCRRCCRGRIAWRPCAPASARACRSPTTVRCLATEPDLLPRRTYGFALPMAPAPADMEKYDAASPSDLEPAAAGAPAERTLEINPHRPGGAK